ncbi:MAG: 16S rRNA (guanine(527)-N(7))-methyltransferase RsmG [Saprospiraceae bacterium]|nr:16S rRNA (guanine(527)-N(7))-methyltransferase RsmG [Saprospiraceae bacterium]
MKSDIILKYFPQITGSQFDKLNRLYDLYFEWNQKVNIISRTDIDNIYLHHVLHSLSILKFYDFKNGAAILDLGTGGGFPGIPLSILLEGCNFTLIDGTAKKIKVVNDIAEKLELKNVKALHLRAEECREKFDFVLTRAVSTLEKLSLWSNPLLKNKNIGPMPPGFFAFKGGDISSELQLPGKDNYYEINSIYEKIPEEYFREKYIIYFQK